MIEREVIAWLTKLGTSFPVIAITGPRQIGKTTLAKQFGKQVQKEFLYLDLENQSHFKLLDEDTQNFLVKNQEKLLIIDEVQHMKKLFPLMRSVIDQHRIPLRFIVLDSASPDMIRHTSQTLAGRITYQELMGFNRNEVGEENMQQLWFRGGFPEAFLKDDDELRNAWYADYMYTYVSRDLPQLGLPATPSVTANLLVMLAHLSANLVNYSKLSDSLGVSANAVKRYVDFLEEAYLVRRLQPFYINIHKRTVKAHKVFIRDSGLLHHLLGINSYNALLVHPSIGASFESFAIEQIANAVGRKAELSFFATHNRGELDLIISKGANVLAAIEIKYSSTPELTRGNVISFQDMKTENKFVVTPSSSVYNIRPGIKCCSLVHFLKEELPKIV